MTAFILPFVLFLAAALLARTEIQLFIAQRQGSWNEGTDLFVYSKGRFRRRMTGVGFLVATGFSLLAWESFPPKTLGLLSLYLTLFLAETVVLVGIAVTDLRETAATARPEDLTRQVDPDRQRRNSQRRPR